MIIALGIFIGFFGLYVHTSAPYLAPYRDAGEMASLLGTLGVAHPPGYPLYTLIGRVATLLPLGNLAYRANVFSAFCAAAALVFLFLTLRTWLKKGPSLIAVLFFGFSNPFWDLATVSEMYALGVLWFCLLLYVTFRKEKPLLFAFLMALGLGVRMDMLLLIPIFGAWFWFRGARREIPWMGFFFATGASVFLYLMFRSLTNPVIDWANPDNLIAVLNSARRKNYSGTLDLLSLSYRTGENFLINMKLYGIHLMDIYGWWGIALGLLGLWTSYKSQKHVGIFFATVFVVTCPIFLFLANMPPNPHSMAVVEASYLLPDLMVAVWIAFGIGCALMIRHPGMSAGRDLYQEQQAPLQQNRGPGQKIAGATIAAVLSVLAFINSTHGFARASKRHNLYARDYVENVFRSVPQNAIAVFHKDIQLFSLWTAQLLEGRRPDVSLVATGLSGSPWYWDMMRRWKTASAPEISLKEDSGWLRLVSQLSERRLVAGYDVDYFDRRGIDVHPSGILMELSAANSKPEGKAVSEGISKLCLYRGPYVYGETPDFYSTDLIGDVARAHHQQGFYLMNHGKSELAEWYLRRSESLDPTFARASSDRAYIAFTQGKLEKAASLYESGARKAEHSVELALAYKSLPNVLSGCRMEAAQINTQRGAIIERLGRLEEARNLYLRALDITEYAQAHYNLAVTYWNRDWQQVITHLRRAVQLDPNMADARNFLAKAEFLARGGK